jgi:hypothetical protein
MCNFSISIQVDRRICGFSIRGFSYLQLADGRGLKKNLEN